MMANYVSIDTVIEQLNRDYISGTHWNIDELKEWTYEALSKISTKISNVKAITEIEVIDGKAKIPAEVELIKRVVRIDTSEKTELHELLPNYDLDDYTYLLNEGFIHVNFEKGLIELHFYTTPIDLEGRPMIPDTVYYKSAVVAFLQYKIGRRAYFAGKILENQLNHLEQEWYFYNSAAKANSKMKILQDSKRFRRLHNRFRL